MSIVVPTLELNEPTTVDPTPRKRRGPSWSWAALIVPLVACLYVGVVILLPALSVVAQAFAKGIVIANPSPANVDEAGAGLHRGDLSLAKE